MPVSRETQPWDRIARAAGFSLSDTGLRQLLRFRDWLRDEAIPAGGLGPAEEGRLDRRHLADSLTFSLPFPQRPDELVDLGTGVGLPGIPLAVLWPETRVILVDRSGKRVDLARRATRVLGLGNVEVVHSELSDLEGRFPAVVSRATMSPDELARPVQELLSPGGLAVIGGSWREKPLFGNWETHQIPSEMLDRAVWLLIMRRE